MSTQTSYRAVIKTSHADDRQLVKRATAAVLLFARERKIMNERARRTLLMNRVAFLQHVGAALDLHAPEAQQAMRAVWKVMRKAVSAGEIADFEARMPQDVAALLRAAAWRRRP